MVTEHCHLDRRLDHTMLSSPMQSVFVQDVLSGTCSSAVDTMAFHREKMNEYLCRRFLAEEIIHPDDKEDENDLHGRAMPLLGDQGSYKYKDWLARSTTLEDLYKHYEQDGASDAPIGASAPPPGSYSAPPTQSYGAPVQGGYDYSGGYDGDVTGYAMMGHHKADTSGYGSGTSYAAPTYSKTIVKAGSDKGMKLQDLFMLALTAVAFLAFGTFIIEVIMCLMDFKHEHEKEHETKLMIIRRTQQKLSQQQQQMTFKPNKYFKTDIDEHTDESINSRRSRALQIQNYLDNLAGKATATLNSLEKIKEDGGVSLKNSLCEANSYSRTLSGTSKIWLPLWRYATTKLEILLVISNYDLALKTIRRKILIISTGFKIFSFGMSWLGGQQIGTLPLLTATVQGLAGANCTAIIYNRH